jgi:hypothetical protein
MRVGSSTYTELTQLLPQRQVIPPQNDRLKLAVQRVLIVVTLTGIFAVPAYYSSNSAVVVSPPTLDTADDEMSLLWLMELWDDWKSTWENEEQKNTQPWTSTNNDSAHWLQEQHGTLSADEQQWGKALNDNVHHAKDAVTGSTEYVEHALNISLIAAEEKEWWVNSEQWFRNTWTESSDGAHELWVTLRNEGQALDNDEAVWWNSSVTGERQWFNHTVQNLHLFGSTIKSWWGNTESEAGSDEKALEKSFHHWWDGANEKERAWWSDTVAASERFKNGTVDKSELWWNITRSTVSTDLKATEEHEQRWWNTTEQWFESHRANTTELPLLYFNESHAYPLLMNGYGWFDYSSDFFLYQSGLDVQINQAYCAIASAAALMNSLRSVAKVTVDPLYAPHPYATQAALLNNSCVYNKVVRSNETFNGILNAPGGLTLSQIKGLLQCHLPSHTWDVSAHQVDPSNCTVDSVRQDLQIALRDPMARVIINYDRAVLGQAGYGHFSPLGSYSASQDAFLVMDVAKYKYPPVWVPTSRLVASMGTVDACGMWNYPMAQDKIHIDFLRPTSSDQLESALKKLGCRAMFRGYVVVKMK